MSTNRVYEKGNHLPLAVTNPATPASGDPVRYGEMCGVADTAEEADGLVSVAFEGVYTLSVKGIDGSGNAAVAVGDRIYYTDADTPKLSKKATGRFFGYALGAVASGATGSINVKLAGS